MHRYREDFAALAGSIVCESEKLIAIGEEVAEACAEETLKNVNFCSFVDIALSSIIVIISFKHHVGSYARESS